MCHKIHNIDSKAEFHKKSNLKHTYHYINENQDDYRNIESAFTDEDSGSSARFKPYFEQKRYDEAKSENHYQNNFSDYDSDFPITHAGKSNFQKNDLKYQSSRSNHNILNLDRKVIVNNESGRSGLDKVYPETSLIRVVPEIDFHRGTLLRQDISRLSERTHSPGISSVAGSAIVDGCGGHCVTFENICSYILQVNFNLIFIFIFLHN